MKKIIKSKPKYHLMLGDQWISEYNTLIEIKAAKKRLIMNASPKNKQAIKDGHLWVIKGKKLNKRSKQK